MGGKIMMQVKLSKRILNMEPSDILVKLGAWSQDLKHAYPSRVFVSAEDYKTIKKNLAARYKKMFPYASRRRISCEVGMDLLGFGPNQSLEKAVRPGYALVDYNGIKEDIKRDQEARTQRAL